MHKIAVVVISNSTRKFDKEYHYIIPHELLDLINTGIRVIVPFGRSDRHIEGYVFDIIEKTEIKGLKKIKDFIDRKPLLSYSMIRLARWMKKRYICTYSDVIRSMLPPGIGVKSSKTVVLKNNEATLRGNKAKIVSKLSSCGGKIDYEELREIINSRTFPKYIKSLEELGVIDVTEEFTMGVNKKHIKVAFIVKSIEEVIEEIESNGIKNIKQIRVLEMLIENEYISVSDITRFTGVSSSVLNTLNKNGYIDYREIEVKRDPHKNTVFEKTFPLKPTYQQAIVLEKTKKFLNERKFKEVLLHGVTGSGKTEVYLQLIENCINKGKQAIVLVPEISLTPQMVERFKGRFGNDVAVLHSRLSLGERYDQWRLIRDSDIKVVVGARSAVFAPVDKLALIIIDEEHEHSYKSELTPKYQAADVARIRCKLDNAVLMYGSATPSVETYYKAQTGKIELMEMTKRANNMILPKVHIVDMREELSDGNRSVFSRKLTCEIIKNIEKKQQTIIFLNRRGYSSFILCRGCGHALMCPNCNITLTYHAYDKRLICHYCGYTIKNPDVCPKCKSSHIRSFGTGTQKIEEEVKKHFKNSTVLRMDMDTTMRKNSHERILKVFKEENINVMVGTQMIAKGHDFPNVTLVGVIAADSLLNAGDYRATERTFQLITQVAGRAGRGTVEGRVIIQTYNTENFSIVCACNQDYESFYKKEILMRKKLLYPPFINLASLILSGINEKMVIDRANEVKKNIYESFKGTEGISEVLGPLPAPLSKIKNKYRWRIIIKCEKINVLLAVLTKISDDYYNASKKNSVNLSVDINPVSML
ncbi:primosomal protein N' [Herbivorax sp. ANBcel31]|uniref:primosomal protein N' n=1 Tax=Herbivorax sp. ANBcel31 TaxID=3069754 RepID=UPI0027AE75EC|nr:primosomal protein N' [Herbivorax sp. ANBcel31]MDQ2087149.1 primosomal protein N' [Herbivorax sp. ANBcel31]